MKQKLYLCFIDLKAAFDSVDSHLLWKKLSLEHPRTATTGNTAVLF